MGISYSKTQYIVAIINSNNHRNNNGYCGSDHHFLFDLMVFKPIYHLETSVYQDVVSKNY